MYQRNWKFLFISLFSLNIFIIITLFIIIFSPTPGSNPLPEKEYIEDKAGAEFTVHSSKQNLTELVNQYLAKALNDKDGKYSVQLDENVKIFASVVAFKKDIPISIEMEPIVQENGDIILKQTEISIGLLNLPKNKILQYVAKAIDEPEWVIIDPDNEEIYIAITQMDIKSNFKVRALQLDLKNDNISFRIKVPNETLGL